MIRAVVFPASASSASTGGSTARSVVVCGISSMPGMKGAGLLKWMPRNRSGPVTASASTPIEIVDVLLPRIASGDAAALIRASVWCLMSTTSGTTSSMKSAPWTASSIEAAGVRFASIAAVEPAGKRPASSKLRLSVRSRSKFRTATSSLTSAIRTVRPVRARTWAMPPPM